MFNLTTQKEKENKQFESEQDMMEKISELQESVSSLLDHMPGMSFTKDAKTGIYLNCNQDFVVYAHKKTKEEVIGLTDYEIFDYETATHFAEDDKKAMSMDEPYIFFEDVPDATGNQRQFQTTKMKFISRDGNQCLLGLCQDVTEAFQIKRELNSTKQAYEKEKDISTVYARLNALTGSFICVYVVDPQSGHYKEFNAADGYENQFAQKKEGTDFLAVLKKAVQTFSYSEDTDRVLSELNMENMKSQIEQNGNFVLVYRIMLDGQPVYVQMNATMVEENESKQLIVSLNNVNEQYQQKAIDMEIMRQKDAYDQITASLAEQYDTLYYIDLETNTYIEISSTDEYKQLNVPVTGSDFFAESRRSIRKYVHPNDQDKAIHLHYKDVMLNNLKNGQSFSMNWRLIVDNQVKYIRHTEILSKDKKHIVVCIKNIDAEIQAQHALKEKQKKSVTYTQIAERLVDHYDLIYYIDCESLHYAELSAKKKSGMLKIQEEGECFFETARRNAERLIHDEDKERIKLFFNKDRIISQLENRRCLTEDYRIVLEDGTIQYTRMSVTYSSDHSHFIICVENRDEDVKREKEHLAALSMANELARRDELTHTKNKTAYHEMENELQRKIETEKFSFGIVVCDINDLKMINDTEGHKAGDDYIKNSCGLICKTFHHSPVFRIGGDEFVVILTGDDFLDRERLFSSLQKQVEENIHIENKPVIASGMSEYHSDIDYNVEDVFNRADTQMYENKMYLKKQRTLQEGFYKKEKNNIQIISEDRQVKLDSLFKAFEIVSEGTYVFLCDMKYDYSRWSKNAVDIYGLPSEYMYGAGDIWEDRIHPEDREVYHKGVDEIFAGNRIGHDMQYRARRLTGDYDVCTCRGVVIRDSSGIPDYFAGTIRNHSVQGHVDTLTGLRNQYGFFEDLESYIKHNITINVLLIGIGKFSEINEMYGYHFGNRSLQLFARELFERTRNTGHIYRIDGTKFALISNALTVSDIRKKYQDFRTYLHEGFDVDGQKLLIDTHCGVLHVDSFDADSQTIYACLNYADEESKLHQHGNLVVFGDTLNEETRKRLEKIHVIRDSIMNEYEGFYLLYQPVVDASTEKLIGAEALIRWQNEQYGMVPPDQFIPILETDTLFPELGEWIIRKAITAAKMIIEKNHDFTINVNLSYTQLEKPDFVDMVFRILDELQYPPDHLCLEITERCRLLDMDLLKNKVVDLMSRGVLVALDDFGTGFSSIGILKEIPISIIKIDRSFVEKIERNKSDRKIIQIIADLACVFDAKVCVEGIETEGMKDILKEYHVKSFQGYYYAKPLELEQLLKWNEKNKACKP